MGQYRQEVWAPSIVAVLECPPVLERGPALDVCGFELWVEA